MQCKGVVVCAFRCWFERSMHGIHTIAGGWKHAINEDGG